MTGLRMPGQGVLWELNNAALRRWIAISSVKSPVRVARRHTSAAPRTNGRLNRHARPVARVDWPVVGAPSSRLVRRCRAKRFNQWSATTAGTERAHPLKHHSDAGLQSNTALSDRSSRSHHVGDRSATAARGNMGSDNISNLSSHRGPQSVWDRRGWQGVTTEERVAPWLVALVGAAIFGYGARRRSWRRLAFMAGGAGLIGCAAAGLCNPRDASVRWRRFAPKTAVDRVTRESMDSFPASDAPSSNAIAANEVNT
jgi:hypothetical protein